MSSDQVYALTPLGEAELHATSTRLTPAELDVLVRCDGQLSLAQLTASMESAARAAFEAAFRSVRDRRLVALAPPDPFTFQWNAQLQQLGRTVGQAEVDAGLASLQRSGFYVQIARQRSGPAAAAANRPLTVVLVEDEPQLARFTETLLKLSGFEVRLAGRREEVVAVIRQPPVPDLLLLDVVLPDADGFDVLARVRQHPALKDVPVIMLTAKATRAAVIQGLGLGADGYITKPFEPDALLRAVRTVLGLPQQP